jgi:hypothetical protein
MQSTLPPKPSDDPHDIVVVAPDVVQVAPADQELSDLLHDAARYLSDAQTNTGSDVPGGPLVPPVDTTFRPAAVNDVLDAGRRRSIGRRAVRTFAALLLAACTGVAAVAWQSSGDVAKKMITKWVPQLVVTSLLPPEEPGPSSQPAQPAVQADAVNAASPPSAPAAQTAPEAVARAVAAPSVESAQLLQSMARDLASVGQEVEQLKASIEQLKASQQQMSRNIARASEQNIRPATSASPPRSAAARARKPIPPVPSPQAAAAPALPQTAAPFVPRQPEPLPQATAQPQADPELASVPRPPMPVR